MDIEAKQRKRRDNIISSLNLAIDALNLAGGIVDIVPAKAVFGPASVLLTMIRVGFPLAYVDRVQDKTHLGFED